MTLLESFRDNMMQVLSTRKIPRLLVKAFNNPERLQKAKDLLASIPEGKALLDYAGRRDCHIILDNELGSRGEYYPPQWQGTSSTVVLNSWLPITGLSISLAHELRHEWQYDQLDLGSAATKTFSPYALLAFKRLIEGDTYAFTKVIAKKLYDKTGHTDPVYPPETLQNDVDMKEAFEEFQDSHRGRKYDLHMLENLRAQTSFDVRSTSELADFKRITRTGTDPRSPAYLHYSNNEELTDRLLAPVSPDVLSRLNAAQPTPYVF